MWFLVSGEKYFRKLEFLLNVYGLGRSSENIERNKGGKLKENDIFWIFKICLIKLWIIYIKIMLIYFV